MRRLLRSPLHHCQTLFPPREATSATQPEGPGRGGDGGRRLPPLHFLQRQRSRPHVQSGTWKQQRITGVNSGRRPRRLNKAAKARDGADEAPPQTERESRGVFRFPRLVSIERSRYLAWSSPACTSGRRPSSSARSGRSRAAAASGRCGSG